jgi:hypothetical protein
MSVLNGPVGRASPDVVTDDNRCVMSAWYLP